MSHVLQARRRVGHGKGAGRRVRASGLIPAVVYGQGQEPVSVALDPKAVKAILLSPKRRNTTFQLEVEGGETTAFCRIGDIQKHPAKRTLVHCDIVRLDPTRPLKAKVPLALVGKSQAEVVGGKIRFVVREVVVEALPAEVPERIDIDITHVGVGEALRLADVAATDQYKLVFRDNAPIAMGLGKVIEVEEDEAETETPAEAEA